MQATSPSRSIRTSFLFNLVWTAVKQERQGLTALCSKAQHLSNPVPLPDLSFDLFSYPVASIVFGDMAIVTLFLLLFFFSCLENCRLITPTLQYPLIKTIHHKIQFTNIPERTSNLNQPIRMQV